MKELREKQSKNDADTFLTLCSCSPGFHSLHNDVRDQGKKEEQKQHPRNALKSMNDRSVHLLDALFIGKVSRIPYIALRNPFLPNLLRS